MLAVYATATVVVTVAAGTPCARYVLTGPLAAKQNRRHDIRFDISYFTSSYGHFHAITKQHQVV